MDKKQRKFEVDFCLDEIDACYDRMENGKLSKKSLVAHKSWVKKQKEKLKELSYRGKLRRLKKGI